MYPKGKWETVPTSEASTSTSRATHTKTEWLTTLYSRMGVARPPAAGQCSALAQEWILQAVNSLVGTWTVGRGGTCLDVSHSLAGRQLGPSKSKDKI